MRLGLWTFASLHIGAYFSQGDEGAQILVHADEFTASILSTSSSDDVLESALERAARGLSLNDTLKLKLLATPGFVERLVAIVASGGSRGDGEATTPMGAATLVARNHAVKVLEALSGSADAQREMVRARHHELLIDLMGRDTTSLFAKKALANTLCNLAALPEHAPSLVRAGAIAALLAEQAADARLRRKLVEVCVSRLASEVQRSAPDVLDTLPSAERAVAVQLAEAEAAAAAASPLHAVRASLVESGVLLYFHTAGGGAAWGLFESLRLGESRAMLVQNVARTALVTCFVPILFVGGVVTAYMRVNKATDSIDEKFYLYFSACVALYPMQRLLLWVERFAPLWLGGHIVGFGSFFAYTLYTESDLLKSDRDLLGKSDRDLRGATPKKKQLVQIYPPPKPPAGGEGTPAGNDSAPPVLLGPVLPSAPSASPTGAGERPPLKLLEVPPPAAK